MSVDATRAGFNTCLIAVLVGLGSVLKVLDTTIANIVLPCIARRMGLSRDDATVVVVIYLLAKTIILANATLLARLLGRKAAPDQKFFASFFQKRSSFLKKRTKRLLSVGISQGQGVIPPGLSLV